MKTKNRIGLFIICLAVLVIIISLILLKKKDKNADCNNDSGQCSAVKEVQSKGIEQKDNIDESSSGVVKQTSSTYTDEKYGFSIQLPTSFNDYKIERSQGYVSSDEKIDFVLKTTDKKFKDSKAVPLSILVYKKEVFSKLENKTSTQIILDKTYIYSYETWENAPGDFKNLTEKDLSNIVKTFKLK